MTQQEGREGANVTLEASPGATGDLGPWSRQPAWGHSVTTATATIPSTLAVPTVSAMLHAHCVYHLPGPLFHCSHHAHPPAVPSILPAHAQPGALILAVPTHRARHVGSTAHSHGPTLRPDVTEPNAARAVAIVRANLRRKPPRVCLPGDRTGEIRGFAAGRAREQMTPRARDE